MKTKNRGHTSLNNVDLPFNQSDNLGFIESIPKYQSESKTELAMFATNFKTMVTFPGCKINIGLFVTEKRPDGFHNLESIFAPIPWHDALEIETVESEEQMGVQVYGMPWAEDYRQNLVWKAYEILKREFPLPPVHFQLLKQLPTGGGLGGGSSNGTASLVLLNKYFNLGLTEEALEDRAAELGSDCPFFVKNQLCRVSGRGEILRPYSLDLNSCFCVIIHPGIHVSTAQAFGGIKPTQPDFNLDELNQLPKEQWKDRVKNDFEHTIFPLFPEIERIKQSLYEAGAWYASMTGTGSSVYAFFDKPVVLEGKLAEYKHWGGTLA
ncbi:4-(cytidine 5'-diphospho)-2-C-methyl-D-erythritol kinase [bacterium SCSIO 12741]|nr:4-(cytidine 5'-diphospho)-2-C-methyl-D-erythritol kinase [bacterium SCSIO 12741]